MSPYIEQAAERARLPIKVGAWFSGPTDDPVIIIADCCDEQPFTYGYVVKSTRDPVDATRAYVELRTELEDGQ